KGRGSRMGFRGPEGAGLIRSGWITPGFWPTEGPHQVVLRRLLPESGTGCRKGIGLGLCHYCVQCLGRSRIALTDGKARGSKGGRQVRGTDAGHTGALVRGAEHAHGDGRAIGQFDDGVVLDADHWARLLSAHRGRGCGSRADELVQHGSRASEKASVPVPKSLWGCPAHAQTIFSTSWDQS